jgi:hypothetical protein
MFSQDPEVTNHSVYMLYRLSIKVVAVLTPYADITLERINAKLT